MGNIGLLEVVDERNRLMVRVESLDKDREKQKQIRESESPAWGNEQLIGEVLRVGPTMVGGRF